MNVWFVTGASRGFGAAVRAVAGLAELTDHDDA